MNITVQTCYNIQPITTILSVYMNATEEPSFIDLIHGMEYIMNQPHESIMY